MASFVLVHGGQHGGWCWEPVAARLEARDHTVVAPDLPGRGGEATTLEHQAGRVVEAITAMKSPPVVVAHSMGGAPAALAVHRSPVSVAGIVFAAAVVPRPGAGVLRDAFGPLGALLMGSLGAAPPLRPVARYLFGHRLPRERQRWLLARLEREDMAPVRTRVPPYSLAGVPSLYVLAARDRVLPPRAQARYAARLAGGRTVVVDGGHSLFAEHPGVLARVAEELAGAATPAGPGAPADLDTRSPRLQ